MRDAIYKVQAEFNSISSSSISYTIYFVYKKYGMVYGMIGEDSHDSKFSWNIIPTVEGIFNSFSEAVSSVKQAMMQQEISDPGSAKRISNIKVIRMATAELEQS